MKFCLWVLAFLLTAELYGYRFEYGGSLTTRAFKLLSGNAVMSSEGASELVLYYGRTKQDKGKMIFNYSLWLINQDGKDEQLRVARWMTNEQTSDIVTVVGDDKGKVIGKREGAINQANPFGAPFLIETDDAKLTVTMKYDPTTETGTITIHGEKTLEDGRTIKWKDEL